jgi:hypothetical protein
MNQPHEVSDCSQLLELLNHQKVLYRRLRLLAERQKALVVQDDAQPLLALLSERQKLVDGLVSLSGQLARYRESWPDFYSKLDAATRGRVSELLEEANSALGMILQSDRRDTAALAARRHQVADRMNAVEAGYRASSAYASAGLSTSRGMTEAEA